MPAIDDSPEQLDPLLPREARAEPLLEKAHDLIRASERLKGGLPALATGPLREVARLLQAMNSYYSNRIEGEHTRPVEIEQALAREYSSQPDQARLQRLALAHIATEQWLLDAPPALPVLYCAEGLCAIHRHLFAQLPEADRQVQMPGPAGQVLETHGVEPGQLRTRQVAEQRHLAPSPAALPGLLSRWGQVYAGVRRGEMQVVAAAAAHHRLLWIHPFADGNGRAARLHSLATLSALGLTTGLWSPLRGLARQASRYAEHLANADMPRMGDLDGRGQRSERMLIQWVDFFLDTCLDQVQFMDKMLHLGQLRERIAALLAFESKGKPSDPLLSTLQPLHYLLMQGDMPRGEFARMTGLGERTASTVLARLFKLGLLASDTPKGPVRFKVPLHALRFLLPALWPEAEADVLMG
jgi:Fic family protein